MTQPDVFTRVFESDPTAAAALVFTDPAQIEKGGKSRDVAAWELLLGSMQLRRAGQRSPANDWLNRASRLPIKDDVFKAELLGEAGQGLYESDRLQDAFEILNSAEAIWRDVCEQAEQACKGAKQEAAADFAAHLLPLFAAAKVKPPASKAAIQSGKQAVSVVQQIDLPAVACRAGGPEPRKDREHLHPAALQGWENRRRQKDMQRGNGVGRAKLHFTREASGLACPQQTENVSRHSCGALPPASCRRRGGARRRGISEIR